MRIISKFYDYYDCIQKYGIDKSILFLRDQEVLDKDGIPSIIKDHFKHRSLSVDISSFNAVNMSSFNAAKTFWVIVRDKCYIGLEINGQYFYDEELFLKYLKESNMVISKEIFRRPKYCYPFACLDVGIDFSIKNKSPIFAFSFAADELSHEYKVIKNPCLKKYQFYKVMEPMTIYQKIQQFIGGVLSSPEKDPWPINDKLKAESHGFDKWSFRKKPKTP